MRRARHVLVLLLAGRWPRCADRARPAAESSPAESGGYDDRQPDATTSRPPTDDTEPATASTAGLGRTPVGSWTPAAFLDWQQVPGPADTTVTVSGEWTLTQRATEAVLDGPRGTTVGPPAGTA